MVLDFILESQERNVSAIHLAGIFALNVTEEPGEEAAIIVVTLGDGLSLKFTLHAGVHFTDARPCSPMLHQEGDGTQVETVGTWVHPSEKERRVDLLTLRLPKPMVVTGVKFHDLGTPTSFVILDAWAEYVIEPLGCPFHSSNAGVSLQDLGTLIRVGDRAGFGRAFDKLIDGVRRTSGDLDEGRGLVLMFLAVVAAAKLESGASRSLHRSQLEAARALDGCGTIEEVVAEADRLVRSMAGDLLNDISNHDRLIERALELIESQYMRDLSDETVADMVGLSTSHFRHLFKVCTGQPFHQYIVSLRLERARMLLQETTLSVQQVADRVGFGSSAHFSRAFTKRFKVAPSAVRQSRP